MRNTWLVRPHVSCVSCWPSTVLLCVLVTWRNFRNQCTRQNSSPMNTSLTADVKVRRRCKKGERWSSSGARIRLIPWNVYPSSWISRRGLIQRRHWKIWDSLFWRWLWQIIITWRGIAPVCLNNRCYERLAVEFVKCTDIVVTTGSLNSLELLANNQLSAISSAHFRSSQLFTFSKYFLRLRGGDFNECTRGWSCKPSK